MQWIHVGIQGSVQCPLKPNTTTVADVKRQVAQAFGIPSKCQQLVFYQQELNNDSLLKDHNIRNKGGVCIFMTAKTKPIAKPDPSRSSVRTKPKAKAMKQLKAAPTMHSRRQVL